MGEEVKKISFGFSKLAKKTSIVSTKFSQPKTDNDKVEFIDCLEGKSIKLKDPIKSENTTLVIPLKRETKDTSVNKDVDNISVGDKNGKDEVGQRQEEPNICNADPIVVKNETLDEVAAREIIEDLTKKQSLEENHSTLSVPLTSNAPIGEAESSLDDYENIPVTQFGLAMLRGMGWAPGKGIGKNEKLVTPSLPTLRPKGMGLGADKVIKDAVESGKAPDKDLKMAKGSFVRVIAGAHKGSYGQIEGFDDESGRMIIKLALKNISVSLNEFMTQLIDKSEFLKNSKVINIGKYEQYKDEEGKKESSKLSERDEKHQETPSSSEQLKRSNYKSKNIAEETHKKTSPSFSRHSKSRHDAENSMSRHPSKSRRSHSVSSHSYQSSSSDSDYSDRKKHRTKKKKPSSHRHKSRTRSRSPKHHRSHKKHKQRK